MSATKTPSAPLPVDGEDCFQLLGLGFNVTYALTRIIGKRAPNFTVRPERIDVGIVTIDEEHVAHVDVSVPVIMAQLGEGLGIVCIDGNHRARRARLKGLKYINAHLLTEAETLECCYTRAHLIGARRNARKNARKERVAAAKEEG